MADRSIVTRLRAEVDQYTRDMEKAAKATESVGDAGDKAGTKGSGALSKLAASARENQQAWTEVSKPLLAVGAGITALGAAALKTGIQYNTLQQTSRAAMTTLLGGAEAANAQMDKLDEFARTSPFAKQTFITAQQQLLGFGMEAEKVLPTLDAIQNAVAAFGGSNQQIQDISFILAQIQAAGKITATDLMQLGQRGVDAATLIGSQMGKTGPQIRESITAGTLGAGEALDALTAGMQERFGGAAEGVKDTFAGAMDRVKAAWRDLSSTIAAPFVGPGGGGLFTGLLNQAADVMRFFDGLPGPIKAVGAGLTGLVGVASLAAGAFFLLAPRLVAVKDAFDTLTVDMPRTSTAVYGVARGLGSLAKAAGIAGVALTGLKIIGSIIPKGEIAGLEQWKGAILGVGDAANSAADLIDVRFGANTLENMVSDLSRSGADKVMDKIFGVINLDKTEQSRKSLEAWDQALASLVQEGKLREASKSFDEFTDAAEAQGKSLDWAKGLFPQYADALAGLANEQADANDSFKQFIELQDEARESARRQAEAFFSISEAVDDADGSLANFRDSLRRQTKALLDLKDNVITARDLGVDESVIQQLIDKGPAGAEILAELIGQSRSDIEKINAEAEAGAQALERFEDAMSRIDLPEGMSIDPITFEIRNADEVEERLSGLQSQAGDLESILIGVDDQASGPIADTKTKLDTLVKSPFDATIIVKTSGLSAARDRIAGVAAGRYVANIIASGGGATGLRVPRGFAGGGVVPGTPPANPRLDNILAQGATTGEPFKIRSGEWIINQKQSEINHEWLKAINAGLDMNKYLAGYVDGGAYSRPTYTPVGPSVTATTPGTITASLIGAQVAIDPNTNIATFVRGEIQMGLAQSARSTATTARRGGR